MLPKERFHRTLSGEKADRVPVAPAYLSLYFEEYIEEFYKALYKVRYKNKLENNNACSINFNQDMAFRAKATAMAYNHILNEMPDWIPVEIGPTKEWANKTEIRSKGSDIHYYKKEREEVDSELPSSPPKPPDYLTGLKKIYNNKKDIWDGSYRLDTLEKLESKSTLASKEDLIDKGAAKLPRKLTEEFGDHYFIYSLTSTPFCYLYRLLGFRGLMVMPQKSPDLFKRLLGNVLKQTLEFMKLLNDVGVDGLYVQEVYTGADLISPDYYEEFVYPFDKELLNSLKEIGLRTILYVCGDVIPRIKKIASLEPDALAFEESKKGFVIDLEDVVKVVGENHCIFGNIDSIKFGKRGSEKEMREEVRRQISIGNEAVSFIVSNGSPFPLETEPKKIEVLIKETHNYEL